MVAIINNTKPERQDDKEWPFVLGFENTVETVNPTECEVTGTIPSWVNGVLYRAGPGKFDIERNDGSVFSFSHWFDGLALIHRFKIENGKVSYNSRFTANDVDKMLQKGTKTLTFGDDFCYSLFKKFFTMFYSVTVEPLMKRSDNNSNFDSNIQVTVTPNFVTKDAVKLVTKTDANILQELDPTTLEPKSLFTYTNLNPRFGGVLSAAHECYDPETKSYFNFTMEPGAKCKFHVFEISPSIPEGRLLCSVENDEASYIHSFFLTKKYVILTLWPFHLGWKCAKLLYEQSFLRATQWDPKLPTWFNVISRETGKLVAKYKYDACFCFHTINAFDDDNGDIVLDLSYYPNADVVSNLDLETTRACNGKRRFELGNFVRFRLPKVEEAIRDFDGKTFPAVLMDTKSEAAIELPRINEKYSLKPYTYVYGFSKSPEKKNNHSFPDALVKIDVKTKAAMYWSEKGYTPGEPIFVANPNGTDEDDGVLLAVVLDGFNKASYLIVLDAKTMKEIARVKAPQVITYGFHGSFNETI